VNATNRAKTHCHAGHPFTIENTKLVKGKWRSCKTCARARKAAADQVARDRRLADLRCGLSRTVMGLPVEIAGRLIITDMGYETPCLIWTGTIAENGYGVITINQKQYKVHRVTYAAAQGVDVADLDPDLVIDHLCRVHECENASHAELVTDRINVLRGVSFAAENAAKTHCLRGHEFTPSNTRLTPAGYRVCRECKRISNAKHEANRRGRRNRSKAARS